ncbi:uncharacterized protein LOC104583529 [Brachypodium distachyon]|uniref:Uncharacterized protein n=1 Tax=Brachypodium distachyon TaxID=15368 RepID=A0A0Q3F9B3_BRADI|nr:uncharacterized protein LOC104583529 [Brachypodium distachyon]KQJ94852.1 hypothetical protein BRADI_3g13636v3 [Brachypodium distachyon]|eukprot:XP_010234256.2 uncharacterized protein LOC104583529 [Brachypodium distachyon]
MLRRSASSLLSACRLLRQPSTPAFRRHPEPRRLCPSPAASVLGARGYVVRRMARRIPPARPDGYSTSDGEADGGYGDGHEDMEPPAEEGAAEEADEELEGYELDFGALFGGAGDKEEEEEEEGEKK